LHGAWLQQNKNQIGGGFGNHRKRESLNDAFTGKTIESYVKWVGPDRSHAKLVGELVRTGGNHPHSIFDHFYNSMRVHRFGRLGKFDFLSLVGRLGLAPIKPGAAYLQGASGPLDGARLLFGGATNAALSEATLETYLQDLDAMLDVGMQVMEDSLCNWQKSPNQFVHFRG
jgi:hypothetical protein